MTAERAPRSSYVLGHEISRHKAGVRPVSDVPEAGSPMLRALDPMRGNIDPDKLKLLVQAWKAGGLMVV
jgi:hypothetical protein